MLRAPFFLILVHLPRNLEVTGVAKHGALLSEQGSGCGQSRIMSDKELSLSLIARSYDTLTSIALGLAFSDFGKWTFNTPSLYSALTLDPSASSGSVKLRIKLP